MRLAYCKSCWEVSRSDMAKSSFPMMRDLIPPPREETFLAYRLCQELVGDRKKGRVFVGLRYSAYMNVEIVRWCLAAGITKHITFHASRHTFAVTQLTLGTDIYTVSRLLGHSEIRTTEIITRSTGLVNHSTPSIMGGRLKSLVPGGTNPSPSAPERTNASTQTPM